MLPLTTKLNVQLIQTALHWLKLLTINFKKYWNLQTIWEWLEMHFRSAWYAIVFYIYLGVYNGTVGVLYIAERVLRAIIGFGLQQWGGMTRFYFPTQQQQVKFVKNTRRGWKSREISTLMWPVRDQGNLYVSQFFNQERRMFGQIQLIYELPNPH